MSGINPTGYTKPFKLGITGPISSGKNVVAKALNEKGIEVLDTDDVVRDLYNTDSELIATLAKPENFGQDILDQSGHIDRAKLLPKVIGKPKELRRLEKLVHPRVRKRVKAFLNDLTKPQQIRGVMVPMMWGRRGGKGISKFFDQIMVIDIPHDRNVQFLMDRKAKQGRPISKEEAEKLISMQWDHQKKSAATRKDWVVHNAGTIDDAKRQVWDIVKKIQEKLSTCSKP